MSETPNPIAVVRNEMTRLDDQFAAALPAHIPLERFKRVLMTAIQGNPDLVRCDRRSMWNAAMKAAQDGLLPDGREGAIVSYKGNAQWLPMVAGIRKKVRNSGEIATWDVHAVYEHDVFDYELGDAPRIVHKPALVKRGKLVAVYSIAVLKSGEISRDVMNVEEVEAIRAKSRAANGPWNDPAFYPEMAKKTVAKRHAKVLPMSTDLDDLMRRDDALYDLEGASDRREARPTLTAALDRLAGPATGGDVQAIEHRPAEAVDMDTGEVVDDREPIAEERQRPQEARQAPRDDRRGDRTSDAGRGRQEPAHGEGVASRFAGEVDDATDALEDAPREQTPADLAFDQGWAARRRGLRRQAPKNLGPSEAKAFLEGWDGADAEIGGE